VIALARSENAAQLLRAQGATPAMADLLDASSLQGAAIGVEAVIHIATAIPRDANLPDAWRANDRVRVEGTSNLLAAARNAGATKYVQQSITRLYGDHGESWIDESTPIAAVQPVHLQSAVEMEGLVEQARDLHAVVVRGGEFYGPGTGTTERLMADAHRGELRWSGDGMHYVSLIHPADMAQAVLLALGASTGIRVLNAVDNEPLRQADFYGAISAAVGSTPALSDGAQASRSPSRRCRNQRLKDLGFVPRYPSYREGLEAAIRT
jgi:2-alkyl-3-oxoalkanoate reductase